MNFYDVNCAFIAHGSSHIPDEKGVSDKKFRGRGQLGTRLTLPWHTVAACNFSTGGC